MRTTQVGVDTLMMLEPHIELSSLFVCLVEQTRTARIHERRVTVDLQLLNHDVTIPQLQRLCLSDMTGTCRASNPEELEGSYLESGLLRYDHCILRCSFVITHKPLLQCYLNTSRTTCQGCQLPSTNPPSLNDDDPVCHGPVDFQFS